MLLEGGNFLDIFFYGSNSAGQRFAFAMVFIKFNGYASTCMCSRNLILQGRFLNCSFVSIELIKRCLHREQKIFIHVYICIR